MDSIAVYGEDEAEAHWILSQISTALTQSSTQHILTPNMALLDFFKYEIPELGIFSLNQGEDLVSFFQEVEKDPWLSSVGFILIAPLVDDDLLDRYRGFNIAYFLEKANVTTQLVRVIEILFSNKDLLNHASLIQKVADLSGEIIIETDILQINFFASLFSNFLYKEGYLTRERKLSLHLCLSELLLNAMEHGNAAISYEEKSAFLSKRFSIRELIEKKMKRPENKGKVVKLSYKVSKKYTEFTILDQGKGFDITLVDDLNISPEALHGRGIYLSRLSSQNLTYNTLGNEVKFTIYHDGTAERPIPSGFVDQEPQVYEPGEVIFEENENGDALYYLISGEFEVWIQGKLITLIDPSEIFMGEMSFLLGNRRSATVKAKTQGKLVKIDRAYFTEVVKNYPEYGIFLSKLLARRLRDANLRYVGLVKSL